MHTTGRFNAHLPVNNDGEASRLITRPEVKNPSMNTRLGLEASGADWRVIELFSNGPPPVPRSGWMTHDEALIERDRLLRGESSPA